MNTHTATEIPTKPPRPSGWGRLVPVFTPFLDLYRRLCRALESLPYEYESPKRFLGLPLLSINLGFDHPAGKMREARGIIAVGNLATGVVAMGIFVARGLFTIALVSYGRFR